MRCASRRVALHHLHLPCIAMQSTNERAAATASGCTGRNTRPTLSRREKMAPKRKHVSGPQQHYRGCPNALGNTTSPPRTYSARVLVRVLGAGGSGGEVASGRILATFHCLVINEISEDGLSLTSSYLPAEQYGVAVWSLSSVPPPDGCSSLI